MAAHKDALQPLVAKFVDAGSVLGAGWSVNNVTAEWIKRTGKFHIETCLVCGRANMVDVAYVPEKAPT